MGFMTLQIPIPSVSKSQRNLILLLKCLTVLRVVLYIGRSSVR